ncbi:MAG: MFS transporter [Ktedonobacteraceae bacterium]|nr:MFS transporter [Chloroflexota bacterium]
MLINRNFALLWSGQAISIIGDFVFNTTLVIWIVVQVAKGQSWAPLAVGGALLLSSLPSIVLGPLAGVFVDRWEKRRTMLAMDALRCATIACLLLASLMSLSPAWQLSMIYITVFVVNACDQFFRPAMLTLIGDIVEEPQQARAMGLGQASMSLAAIIGPPLAPPLLLAFGVQWALLLNALSFVISFTTIMAIQVPRLSEGAAPRQAAGLWQEFSAGLRFLLSSRILVTLIVSTIIAMLGAGVINTLDVFFVTQNLHTPVALYGTLDAVLGIGTIVGAILASVFAQRIGLTRTIWCSILALGVLVTIYARLTGFLPAAVLLFVMGVPLATLAVASGPLILQMTPREMVGRVSSLVSPISMVAFMIATGLSGYLDGVTLHNFHAQVFGMAFGPVDTLFTASGLLIFIGGVYAMIGLRSSKATAPEISAVPVAQETR